jgi:hypothetical protein
LPFLDKAEKKGGGEEPVKPVFECVIENAQDDACQAQNDALGACFSI